jgi:hypothetical protein
MQSSTNNHYLPEEFNDSFFYNTNNHEDKHLFFQSQPIINDQEEDDENYLRETINGMESGLTGLEIKGKVRTLSPVLFYQTNTRYLIMSNNELKYLPAGK